MPLQMTPHAISPSTVLTAGCTPHISCYWCRKVAAICDGRRTLQDMADLLYLPLPILQKLAQKALDQGWFTTLGAPSPEATLFWQQVKAAVGQDQAHLLEKAAQMTRQQPGNISSGTISNFLIALELLLDDQRREGLIPKLDEIRQNFMLS